MEDQHNTEAANADPLNPAISKSLYSICYYLAFGTVYASELAKEFIPPDSMIIHGLRDGAEAAQNAWKRSHESDATAESEMDLPETPAAAAESAPVSQQETPAAQPHVNISASAEDHAENHIAVEKLEKPVDGVPQHESPKEEKKEASSLKKVLTELGTEILAAELVG